MPSKQRDVVLRGLCLIEQGIELPIRQIFFTNEYYSVDINEILTSFCLCVYIYIYIYIYIYMDVVGPNKE